MLTSDVDLHDSTYTAGRMPGRERNKTLKPRFVYVASSWRNKMQIGVVAALQAAGLDVYDFRNPRPGKGGFNWREIDLDWMGWTPQQWAAALSHPIAQAGFAFDKEGMDRADCCVLVLPCGRSAHLEAGYMAGQGKPVFTLCIEKTEPELMALLLGPPSNICTDLGQLLALLDVPN